mmetsp:Transcript_11497/g.31812  ORF Transcript_11497/g.31812 Transcript_11497/m.31812 type:complete len:259 (-) Transcript_11497:994-1770(-)
MAQQQGVQTGIIGFPPLGIATLAIGIATISQGALWPFVQVTVDTDKIAILDRFLFNASCCAGAPLVETTIAALGTFARGTHSLGFGKGSTQGVGHGLLGLQRNGDRFRRLHTKFLKPHLGGAFETKAKRVCVGGCRAASLGPTGGKGRVETSSYPHKIPFQRVIVKRGFANDVSWYVNVDIAVVKILSFWHICWGAMVIEQDIIVVGTRKGILRLCETGAIVKVVEKGRACDFKNGRNDAFVGVRIASSSTKLVELGI